MKMESIRIRFGDFFSAKMPRYKRISELRRDEAIYLPAGLIPDEIYNYVNNLHCVSIPQDLLDSVLVVELQKYDTMIDVNGKPYDWSDEYGDFSPKDPDDYPGFWFEKKVNAVNNVFFEDLIDLEASIIYNLIEISPQNNKISLDYLRYYFWNTKFCVNESDCSNCEYFTGQTCKKMPFAVETLEKFRDASHDYILENYGEERYYIFPEVLDQLEIEIDSFSLHENLVALHRQYQEEQSRAFGRKELQERFGSPLYEELKMLESQVYSVLTPEEKQNAMGRYTGFVRSLEEALTIFNDIKRVAANGISQASLMAFKTSCEIILNAKLRIIGDLYWDENGTFYDNIRFIKNYKSTVFKRRLTNDEISEFFNNLNYIRVTKNKGSHTSDFIPIEKAEEIVEIACNKVIKGIIEYIK